MSQMEFIVWLGYRNMSMTEVDIVNYEVLNATFL